MVRSGSTTMRPARSTRRYRLRGRETRPGHDAADTRRPDHGPRRNARRRAVGRTRVDAGRVDADDRRVRATSSTPSELQRRHRAGATATHGNVDEQATGRLDEQHALPRACPSTLKSRCSVSRASSPICPAISTPVGPAAHDDERQPRRPAPPGPARPRPPRTQSRMRGAQVERALERLELRCVLGPSRRGRSKVGRAARDHERCRRGVYSPAEPFGRSASTPSRTLEVEAHHLAPGHARVCAACAGRAAAATRSPPHESAPVGVWVGERLEEVEVSAGRRASARRRRRGAPSPTSRPANPPPTMTTRAMTRLLRLAAPCCAGQVASIAPSSWSSFSLMSSPPA